MSHDLIPAIVAIGFSRAHSLQRLLRSLDRAGYPDGVPVPLVIAIDGGGGQDVVRVAEEFVWRHGPKTVRRQPQRLGLRAHVLSCGDLSRQYGGVILLEDDLVVSPAFYQYAADALRHYADTPRVAGISLYGYSLSEYGNTPFLPLDDGFDTYFVQAPSSWGQAWTATQWARFRAYHDAEQEDPEAAAQDNQRLPVQAARWPATSWKKVFFRYLCRHDELIVYPRTSLTTNLQELGEHVRVHSNDTQTPLLLQPRPWRFAAPDPDALVYDGHFELSPAFLRARVPSLQGIDFECDLWGSKLATQCRRPWLLSPRPCRAPVRSFGLEFVPVEANILQEQEGSFFSLGRPEDFDFTADRLLWRRPLLDHAVRHSVAGEIRDGAFRAGAAEVKASRTFRLGRALLSPLRWWRGDVE